MKQKTNGAPVAYLCSPNPNVIAHSKAHKDALNSIAVEEFIKSNPTKETKKWGRPQHDIGKIG